MTQKELKEYLVYNKNTGLFYWRVYRNPRAKVGDIAGSIDNDGYVDIKINRKHYKAHRLAWLYFYGDFPSVHIDHINRVRNDNRIDNLRDVSISINCKNRPIRFDNKSGVSGVSWYKPLKKWAVRVGHNNKNLFFGYYKSLKVAKSVREIKEKEFGYIK